MKGKFVTTPLFILLFLLPRTGQANFDKSYYLVLG